MIQIEFRLFHNQNWIVSTMDFIQLVQSPSKMKPTMFIQFFHGENNKELDTFLHASKHF